jgi:PAS domain S-box-containing protein/putative nucleotidyltransferase with HDIG domain
MAIAMKKVEPGRSLIFGGNIDLITSLGKILSDVGYNAEAFTSSDEALAAIKMQKFDVILMDVEMPERDGGALLHEALKADPNVGCIIITGRREDSHTQISAEVLRMGAFDYILKPFAADELLMKISRVLEVRRLRRSEDLYRSIFEDAPEGIYLMTPEERYITANGALAGILGYDSPHEMIASLADRSRQLYAEPDRRVKLMRVLRRRDVFSGFESYAYRKDGSRICILESIRAVRDKDGKLLYYRGKIEDISARKKAEEALLESEKHMRLWAERNEKNKDLFLDIIDDISESYHMIEELFTNFVISIVRALEERRPWMRGHSQRVATYSMKIAREMGLSGEEMRKLRIAAFLHDIGEFVKYDYPLDKPALTKKEFEMIKRHPVLGETALKRIKELRDITPIIRHHHERMDGTGYPDGLKGEEIPVGARILHLADSFDSMTAPRPYRHPAPGKEYAFLEFRKNTNTQFDPKVAEVALKVL